MSLGTITSSLFLAALLIATDGFAKGICADDKYWNGTQCVMEGDFSEDLDWRDRDPSSENNPSTAEKNNNWEPGDSTEGMPSIANGVEECAKARKKAEEGCKDLSTSQSLMAAAVASSGNLVGMNGFDSAKYNTLLNGLSTADAQKVKVGCGEPMNECKLQCTNSMRKLESSSDKASRDLFAKSQGHYKFCSGQADAVEAGYWGTVLNALTSTAGMAMQALNSRNNGYSPTTPPTGDPFPTTNPSYVDPGGTLDSPTLTTSDPYNYDGYKAQGSNGPKYDATGSGGSGGPSGGAYPGGAPLAQQGGGGGSGIKTDIDRGLTTGGGGFTTSGVGFGGGGGGGRNGSGRDYDRGLDLSKYLPGGECDPANPAKTCASRGIASLEKAMHANGITGANDLSNFEKVSRAMATHRPRLTP